MLPAYAALEENDEDLAKLKSWLAKVQARDLRGAGEAERAVGAVNRWQAALDPVSAAVDEAEGSRDAPGWSPVLARPGQPIGVRRTDRRAG